MEDKKNIEKPQKGLSQDTSLQDQPKGTARFALNADLESKDGDRGDFVRKRGNTKSAVTHENLIPIGKEYIGDGETCLFFTSIDGQQNEIGIVDINGQYKAHVKGQLGFRINHQIKAVYRLRKGCEKTVYWVDGRNNKPMFYNFAKPNDFLSGGVPDKTKFYLQRVLKSLPIWENISVVNGGGVGIKPGSLNFSIRLLDREGNATGWLPTSPIVNIYNDSTEDTFLDIYGSINSQANYQEYEETNKSVRIDLSGLDTSFPFYQIAIIEYTSGSGQVTDVKVTDRIPTTKDYFIYNGSNFIDTITETEVQLFEDIIDSAEDITHIDNQLELANTTSNAVEFCKLQSYASKIQVDLAVKKVLLNTVSDSNAKEPTVHFDGVEYMPKEIYSLGIVYVFDDFTFSPALHIPGKNPTTANQVFSPAADVYPMSIDNTSKNTLYIDNTDCGGFWGHDSENHSLEDTFVRHHRFPSRREIGLPLVEEESVSNSQTTFYQLEVNATGVIDIPCSQEEIDGGLCTTLNTAEPFYAIVEFTVNGVTEYLDIQINPSVYTDPSNTASIDLTALSTLYNHDTITVIAIREKQDDGSEVNVTNQTSPKGVNYSTSIKETVVSNKDKIYSANLFGLKFSNVILPPADTFKNKKVIGYYIVRHERFEEDKTVLDTGVIIPSMVNQDYVANGFVAPEFVGSKAPESKRFYGLIHPEHKFRNQEYTSFTRIEQEGTFRVVSRTKSKARYQDVLDGTSYDPDLHRDKYEDKDGWSLKVVTRDNELAYTNNGNDFTFDQDQVDKVKYLDALEDFEADGKTYYNVSGDNKIGSILLKSNAQFSLIEKLPYVYLRRDNDDPYSDYRQRDYIKVSRNIHNEETVTVFGGDTYISPMRYVSSVFWQNRIAKRANKVSLVQIIAGIAIVALGALALLFPPAGLAATLVLGAGLSIIGGGILLTSAGIKKSNLYKAYAEDYEKGLREALLDSWAVEEYQYGLWPSKYDTPEDDEVQWFGDCATDLWFESQVNIALRLTMTSDSPTFLPAPGIIQTGYNPASEETDKANVILSGSQDVFFIKDKTIQPLTRLDRHMMNKLSIVDGSRNDNRAYLGHSLGEYYAINPDFDRPNVQKTFGTLPLDYDCCSECLEEFPHRIHYSEKSFDEEQIDNYRVFLPNNYVDMPANTGRITSIFTLSNNIYVITQGGLWHFPQNIQERVTDDVISFIGTGEYFSIPPRVILDDSSNGVGTDYKFGIIKTKYGVLIPSEKEGSVFLFNGGTKSPLQEISINRMYSWFKNNMDVSFADEYKRVTGEDYPFKDACSHPYGVGFISTYDNRTKKFYLTKRDFSLDPRDFNSEDYIIISDNGEALIFNGYQATIDQYLRNGYSFDGFDQYGRMTFTLANNDPEADQVVFVAGSKLSSIRKYDKSWTISYSLKDEAWVSFHSFLPNFYYHVSNKYYSWSNEHGLNSFWQHDTNEQHSTFYGKLYKFIVEYVSVSNPIVTKLTDALSFQTDATRFDPVTGEHVDVRFETFNKVLVYNSRQSSGVLSIKVIDKEDVDYLVESVNEQNSGTVLASKKEKDWHINDLRDHRISYDVPMFISDHTQLGPDYYIDKIVNTVSIDFDKLWYELSNFRDKFIVVRFIKDDSPTTKLSSSFFIEDENFSER